MGRSHNQPNPSIMRHSGPYMEDWYGEKKCKGCLRSSIVSPARMASLPTFPRKKKEKRTPWISGSACTWGRFQKFLYRIWSPIACISGMKMPEALSLGDSSSHISHTTASRSPRTISKQADDKAFVTCGRPWVGITWDLEQDTSLNAASKLVVRGTHVVHLL